MVVTGDNTLAENVRVLRNLGKPEPWKSVHYAFGTNARMHEWAAALGIEQLAGLATSVGKRRDLAERYWRQLDRAALPGLRIVRPDHPYSGYKVPLLAASSGLRDALKQSLLDHNIQPAGPVYEVPLHQQPVLRSRHPRAYPGAEVACSRQVCLPIHTNLTVDDIDAVVAALASHCGDSL